jgi:hypothetical protein
MTDFKPGDKVLIPATVLERLRADDNTNMYDVNVAGVGLCRVPPDVLLPAPEPPYVDPELVPGMVVAPEDRSDDRLWWVCGTTRTGELLFEPPSVGFAVRRAELPAEIRPVFDPREVTT